MKNFASIIDSEEAVDNTLVQIRRRLERSTSQENTVPSSYRLELYNRYASYELLAHWLAYELPKEFEFGYTLCKVLDDDGVARYYHPIKLLTQNRGLLAFVLIPYDKTNQNSRIHVAFVGTLNLSGVVRDLEYGGAGQESFEQEREGILQQINDMVETVYTRTKKKINLLISGHSLGGSDAQNCAALIIKGMAHNIDENKFGYFYKENDRLPLRVRKDLLYISKIDVSHLNSPGVSEKTSVECDYDSKLVISCFELKIHMHVLRVKNDFIQGTGQSRIFANIDPHVAEVELMCFTLRDKLNYNPINFLQTLRELLEDSLVAISYSGANIAKAHCAFHFKTNSADEIIEYCNNLSPFGRGKVFECLSERSSLENSLPVSIVKSGLHRALKSYDR